MIKMSDQKLKMDAGKLRLTLVPTEPIRAIARVMHNGLDKGYTEGSWREVECPRLRDALYRHFLDYLDDPYGADEESGLPHLEHLLWNAAALVCNQADEYDFDYPTEPEPVKMKTIYNPVDGTPVEVEETTDSVDYFFRLKKQDVQQQEMWIDTTDVVEKPIESSQLFEAIGVTVDEDS